MRSLDDGVEKVIGMLLAGKRKLRIEAKRSPVPALRGDAGKDCSSPMFVIDPWQQHAEFGCYAGPGLLLQAALAQNAFEKSLAFNQAPPGDAGGQTTSDVALQRCFPARGEAVIDPDIGSKQNALDSLATVLDRAQLDFHLTLFRHGGIRAVEGAIGPRGGGPAGEHG